MEHHRLRELFDELRRRRVYRVGALYLAGVFILLQVADLVFPAVGLPAWAFTLLVLGAAVAFPVVLVLAWLFELTAEGLRPEQGRPLTDFVGHSPWARRGVVVGVASLSLVAGLGSWVLWLRPAVVPVAAGAGALDPARVAVLYFDDMSPGGEAEHMAAGLTEGLIHELSQVEALEIVSRSGVKPFRDAPVTMDSVVRALRVGSVVEGSVHTSGDRIRVVAQLIDGATNAHLESVQVERPREELFALQDEIAREVSDALRRRLGRTIALQEGRRGTEEVEAWTTLLEAREAMDDSERLWREDREAGRRALLLADSLFARAAAEDPGWAEPWVGRASAAAALAVLQGPSPGAVDTTHARAAIDLADRALRLDPENAAALSLRGSVRHALGDALSGDESARLRAQAGDDLERATRLEPRSAVAWANLSAWLVEEGRFAEAGLAAERAREADAFLDLPEEVLHQYYYATVQKGPVDEARRACDEGRLRFPDEADFVLCQLFLLASFPQVEPDLPRAWRALDSLVLLTSEPNRPVLRGYGMMQVAKVAARLGLPDSAEAIVAAAHAHAPRSALTYDEAHLRVLLAQPDRAMDLLEAYLEMDPDTAFLAGDWWFSALRSQPRFRAMVGER